MSAIKAILGEQGIGNTGNMDLKTMGRKVAMLYAAFEMYAMGDNIVCCENDVVCYDNQVVYHHQPPTVAFMEIV